MAISQACLESAGALRFQVRITDKTAGKEAVEVEEGWLGNAFRIGTRDRKSSAELHLDGCSDARGVLKAAEHVPTDGDVGRDLPGVGSPLRSHGLVIAGPVLVGKASLVIPRVECLVFGVRGENQA